MVTDPIADFLTVIRNAYQAGCPQAETPDSKAKQSLAQVLQDRGYLKDYRSQDGKLLVSLRYDQNAPAVKGLKRVSRPSLRVYRTADKLPRVKNGYGIAVISTSQGVMADDAARQKNLGGEVICEVW